MAPSSSRHDSPRPPGGADGLAPVRFGNSSPGADLSGRFDDLRGHGRAALIPFVTAGYPTLEASVDVLDALVRAGSDVVELGIPFSDPLADGPTIQRSSFRALENGMSVEGVLELLTRFRQRHDTPVVLFSYLNPILRRGFESFLADARDAGAQGLLLTDLPAGADPEKEDAVREAGLDLIRLVAPTTAPSRIADAVRGGSGFVYYISRTGVTGARTELRRELAAEVETMRDAVDLPIAVGFGISSADQAALVARVADGVVVGSALIDALDRSGVEGAEEFLRGLRAGMDGDT